MKLARWDSSWLGVSVEAFYGRLLDRALHPLDLAEFRGKGSAGSRSRLLEHRAFN